MTEIRNRDSDVEVTLCEMNGKSRTLTAPCCICTVPLPVPKTIKTNFSSSMTAAIAGVSYIPAVKLGLQMRRRFWEQDERIYGGVTLSRDTITQIWYPSSGYLSQNGVLLGAYNFGDPATQMGDLTASERIELALAQGQNIHPQYREAFETGFSVAWHRVPFTKGGWSAYDDASRRDHYRQLNHLNAASTFTAST